MLMVMVIGYRLAGRGWARRSWLWRSFLPDCILTLFANRMWLRYSDSPWRQAIQRAMAPVAIGLMLSGTYAIARLSILNLMRLTIAAATFAYFRGGGSIPLLLISAGGLAYLAYFIATAPAALQ